MNDNLLAYMAGFVDADGSIGIVTVSKIKRCIAKITVTNCNYEVMNIFSDQFGGKIREKNNKNPKWRTCYEWSLTNNKAKSVVEVLLPFLKIKKEQAKLVIELQNLRAQNKRDGIHARWHRSKWEEKHKIMMSIKDKCIILNKKGVQ